MENVTMKSTKQEIFNALQEAQRQLEQRQEVMGTPAETVRKEEETKIVEAAAEDVKNNIFSDEMNQKYKNLEEAIAIMEARLKEQYGIEEAYQHLVTVINAEKQAQLTLDEEYRNRRESIDKDLRDRKAQAERTKDDINAEIADYKEELAQERRREEEEYEYDLKRSRKKEEDEYNDRKAAAEKELAAIKAESDRIAQENAEQTERIKVMEEKVAGIPDMLENKYQEGYADGEKAAGKDYGYKKAMADKDHEYQVREKDNEIHRLEDTVDAQAIKIDALETKLDAAYSQIRELATKTVESNGGIKVLTGGDSTSKR